MTFPNPRITPATSSTEGDSTAPKDCLALSVWLNRMRGALFGLAVGDALGAAVEFSHRGHSNR